MEMDESTVGLKGKIFFKTYNPKSQRSGASGYLLQLTVTLVMFTV
jgi:hypothetical protein